MKLQWQVTADGSILGAAQTLFAVLGCAVHAVLSRHYTATSKLSLLLVLAGQQTVGLAYCVAVLPFHWSFADFASLRNIDAQTWCLAMAMGIVKFLVATGLYIAALSKIPAGRAGNYLILTPIFGLIAANGVLSEQFGPLQWLGASMALLSVAFIQFRNWKFQ
jgi:drug/metabolite transporter (DMT)-like permease